jgi:ubiquinone/menaquinone biosynthesis C-methylase UbiE
MTDHVISRNTSSASNNQSVKQCCARLYESNFAKLLLGDCFHPGGLKLTERLGIVLGLKADTRVLDVASGRGISAIFMAEHFGCEVLGLDYGSENVRQANELAASRGLSARVRFERADAESLPVEDARFDAIVCECAFCTFPDKTSAAKEFSRALRSEGQIGLSDLTRVPVLPKELNGLLAHIACIADAQPIDGYKSFLTGAGFDVTVVEDHDDALHEMVQQIRGNLLAAEIMVGLRKLDLPPEDLVTAKQMAKHALEAIQRGQLGYALICGLKP